MTACISQDSRVAGLLGRMGADLASQQPDALVDTSAIRSGSALEDRHGLATFDVVSFSVCFRKGRVL